jgi:hypothetical protein
MWRREERLAYWLSNSTRPNPPRFRFGSLKYFLRRLGLYRIDASLHGCAIDLCVPVHSLENLPFSRIQAIDGLGSFACQLRASDKILQITKGLSQRQLGTKTIMLLGESQIRSLNTMGDWKAATAAKNLIFDPAIHPLIAPSMGKGMRVHSEGFFATLPDVLGSPAYFLNLVEAIQDGTAEISAIPMLLRSIGRENFKHPNYGSFLREAEAVRGVPPGRGELLAVFPNVPIEIVSRLRFVQDRNLIIFTLALPISARSTRLHDLAAVRDLSTKVVHLVAHRTRYKTVVLN